jgi:nucleoside-diphosphate-sugar epimerase
VKRLLIVGCGDIGLRIARALQARYKIFGLTRARDHLERLRLYGITPILGDLDDKSSLRPLAGLADEIIHCAPPPNCGKQDTRTRHLLAALGRRLPRRLIYLSTSGVYGNCDGELVSETRFPNAHTDRAARRIDCETLLRNWGRRNRVCVCILRSPGIYASDRLPLRRIESRTPALIPEDDVYSNHIHADDLAKIVVHAIRWGQPGRAYNANDDTRLRMGDYFDMVADHFHLPRPPRISLKQAEALIPGNVLSFMKESRRLVNERVKRELRLRLKYPTVVDGLAGKHECR